MIEVFQGGGGVLTRSCRGAVFGPSMVHFLRATAQTLENKTAKFLVGEGEFA